MSMSYKYQQKKSLGQYLKSLRKTHKLSLKELENRSALSGKKISVSCISKIESGKTSPTIPVLMVLSKIYDVKLRLILEKLELESSQIPDETNDTFDEIKFNEFPDLDEEKIKKGLSLLKSRKKSIQSTNKNNLHSILLHTVIFLRRSCKLDLAKEAAELLILISQKNKKNLSRAFFELAFIYKLQKNFPLALTAISESERNLCKIKEPFFAPHTLHLKGIILRWLGKYKEAIPIYHRAIKKYEKGNLKHESCKVFNCIGESYIQLRQFNKARLFFEKALMMAKKHHFLRSISLAYHNIGCSYYHENKLQHAITNFKESNTLAEAYNCQDIIFHNYYFLMNIYEKINDMKSKKYCIKGLKYYFHKLSDIPIQDNKVQKYIEQTLE